MKKISNFFIKDNWLSKIINKNTYSIVNPSIKNIDYPKKSEFVFTKIEKNKKKLIQYYLLNNFKKINSNIIFEKKIKTKKEPSANSIRLAQKKDCKKIQEISVKSLLKSRFHIDKKINHEVAKNIKKEWIKNFFKKKRGDALFVIEIKKNIVGFVLLIFKKKNMIIDLIAINKENQSKGLGKLLIDYIEYVYRKKFKKILVGTQSNNLQSIKFYKKMGFKVAIEYEVINKHL